MGDWTAGAAVIYACPPRRVRTVLDILEFYGLADDEPIGGTATDDTEGNAGKRAVVTLGEEYSCDESFRCGSAADLSDELIEKAPEVAFIVYEEPAYNWVGTFCSYVPELGLFTADCDTTGEPLLSRSYVLGLDDEPADVRQKHLGVPWMTAIAAMPTGAVAAPDQYAAHWDRRHDEVVLIAAAHGGGDLTFPAPVSLADVDQALAERGFQRIDDWTALDETGQLWRADVYRSRDGIDDPAQIRLQF